MVRKIAFLAAVVTGQKRLSGKMIAPAKTD
jgi:hypothetical protein